MLGVKMFRSQDRSSVGVHSSRIELTSLEISLPPPWQPDKPNWKDGLDGSLINPYVGLVVSHVNLAKCKPFPM